MIYNRIFSLRTPTSDIIESDPIPTVGLGHLTNLIIINLIEDKVTLGIISIGMLVVVLLLMKIVI